MSIRGKKLGLAEYATIFTVVIIGLILAMFFVGGVEGSIVNLFSAKS
jgi:preprotein translocase subunit SecE